MIRFYFHPTPNPQKISMMLEASGLEYEVLPVDTRKGQQHDPAFRAVNPNGKVPAIVDTDGAGGTSGSPPEPRGANAASSLEGTFQFSLTAMPTASCRE